MKWNSLSYFKVVIIGKILHLAYLHSLNEIISWNSSKSMLNYIYIYLFVLFNYVVIVSIRTMLCLTSKILWHVPFLIIDKDCTNEIGFTMLAIVKHDVQPLCHGASTPLHAHNLKKHGEILNKRELQDMDEISLVHTNFIRRQNKKIGMKLMCQSKT